MPTMWPIPMARFCTGIRRGQFGPAPFFPHHTDRALRPHCRPLSLPDAHQYRAHRPLQGSVVLYQHQCFHQEIKANEVGSSAMPHKVNPLTLRMRRATSVWPMHCWVILPTSCPYRAYEDLSDSTVLRNIGVPFGHNFIAFHPC